LAKGNTEKQKSQGFKSHIKGFFNFLSRRYVWSGLLAGIIWMFSALFVSTVFSLPRGVVQVLFFPVIIITIAVWIVGIGPIDVFPLLTIAMFLSMFLGVIFTYFVHRILTWRKLRSRK
jgi:hypothetical protein